MLMHSVYDAGMDNKILSIVYTFFLGLILALFVGLGISTFYPGPKAPEYKTIPVSKEVPGSVDMEAQKQYEEEYQAYSKKSQEYNRNVSIISLVSAVTLLAVSLLFEKRNGVIANGVLLGGLFTLLYSVGRGFYSEDSKLTFITVSVGLLVALYLGYRRFNEPPTPKAKLVTKKKSRS